ncbi:MAG: glycosyltransferase family 39 protein, partial [Planctomycetes bacterium]|nr:glycosyltransferase family 39 protein [Planctomycetota bacterium]
MSPGVPSASSNSRVVLLASLALYAALGVAFIAVARHLIGPDGIAYIRIAGYYLEGDLDLAVAFHWGPLLSWLLVPCLAIGANGILAIKVINLIAGGLVLVGVHRLRISVGLTGSLSTAVQLAAALLVSPWVPYTTPDLLLAGLLTLYFAESYRACVSPSVAAVVRVGLLGGLAGLAKPYGLPFFAAHFTVMLLLFDRGPLRARATRLLTGVACFALLMGPWVVL